MRPLNFGLLLITADGKFDRVAIMREAHKERVRILRDCGGYTNPRRMMRDAMLSAWSKAGDQMAIVDARRGNTREYVAVARDVLLPLAA